MLRHVPRGLLVPRCWPSMPTVRHCTTASSSSASVAGPMSALKAFHNFMQPYGQYFVHVGNVILLLAINQTDMLSMRLMMVTASGLGMAYNLLQPKPLFAPALWGCGFLASHFYNIYLLLKEKQKMTLSTDQEHVYESAFMRFGFTPRQFLDLLEQAYGQWNSFSENALISKQGDPLREVHYLMEGECVLISTTGDDMFKIQPGKGGWIGEFFDPNSKPEVWEKERFRPISCKCITSQCRTLSMDMKKVDEIVKASPRLTEFATRVEVSDLWGKLHRAQPEHRRQTYQAMIAVAVSDGFLEDHEIKLAEEFRARHKLTDDDHSRALEKVGWTQKDWDARRKPKT
eukprot:TRINITY_DN62508_c0_g1_i1.p1 TRINITY_DN62508_c0_g1~~TRINITY_DN62508_c0_g1_i1.p1  ORF type:complete len:344 (+),score=41.85 TRINITY_DN62508_c0_g1_i1:89-1120(+)